MGDRNQKLKLSAIDWVNIAAMGACIFTVVKYGGVSSTPPYFIVSFLVLSWLVDLWKVSCDIVTFFREAQQTASESSLLWRMVRRVFYVAGPLFFKALLTGNILWRLKILSQLEELSA